MAPDPRLAQARQLWNAGDRRGAIGLVESLRRDRPRDAEAWYAHGAMTVADGRLAEGIASLRKARALARDRMDIALDLGRALIQDQQYNAGIAELTRAAARQADPSAVLAALAFAQYRARRHDQARASADRALAARPELWAASLTLARLDLREGKADDAEARLGALTADHVPAADRATAWHLLGSIEEKREAWDAAFDAHMAGNAAFAELPDADRLMARGKHGRIPEYLGPGHERALPRWVEHRVEDGAAIPVFLVGFPRSGTTLAEQALSAHPGLVSSDERGYIEHVYQRALELIDHAPADAFVRALDGLTDAQLRELREHYWSVVRADMGAKLTGKRLVDKNPLDILDAALIARVFPEAPMIVMLRDPRDACVSALFQPFALNSGTVRMLRVEDVGAYYRTVMEFWLAVKRLAPVNALEVRYEDLVGDLEGTARAMLGHIGVGWDDRVLRFDEQAARRAVGSASFEQVTEPVHGRSVGKWRRYEGRIGPVFDALGDLPERLGYAAT